MIASALFMSQAATAGIIQWTDWTGYTTGSAASAEGSIGSIDVSYTGEINFAQTGTGTNYWTEGSPAPYTGNSIVDNAPTPAEMIATSGSGITNTITFSEAVTDPIMAIVSQGRLNLPVEYDFDTSFTLLSEGRGYWGDGNYQLLADDVLKGYELHGVIQFEGTYSSISWVADTNEYWHGFTFGLPSQTSVPAPGALILIGIGLLGLTRLRRS
jgi:hypothetical protein